MDIGAIWQWLATSALVITIAAALVLHLVTHPPTPKVECQYVQRRWMLFGIFIGFVITATVMVGMAFILGLFSVVSQL